MGERVMSSETRAKSLERQERAQCSALGQAPFAESQHAGSGRGRSERRESLMITGRKSGSKRKRPRGGRKLAERSSRWLCSPLERVRPRPPSSPALCLTFTDPHTPSACPAYLLEAATAHHLLAAVPPATLPNLLPPIPRTATLLLRPAAAHPVAIRARDQMLVAEDTDVEAEAVVAEVEGASGWWSVRMSSWPSPTV